MRDALHCHVEITRQLIQRQIHRPVSAGPVPDLPLAAFAPLLAQLQARGAEVLRLGGGEPLAHADFWAIAQLAVRSGLRIQVETSARLCAYPQVAARLARLQLDRVVIPLFAAHAAAHDRWAGVPGAHTQQSAGIEHLLRPLDGPVVELLLPVFQGNLHEIEALLARYAPRPKVCFRILACRRAQLPQDAGFEPVALAELGRELDKVLDRQRSLAPRIAIEGVPFCFWRHDDLYPMLDTPWKTQWFCQGMASGTLAQAEFPTRKPDQPCLDCSFHEVCPGIAPEFAGLFDTGFRVPRRTIPNFLRLLPVTEQAFRARVRPDQHRFLRVESPSGTSHYELVSAFYSARHLARAKALGLLYVNVSDRFPVTDFSAQLRQLQPIPQPADGLPATYQLSDLAPFGGEGPFASDWLEDFAGGVLDVGFGDFHYGMRIRALAQSGQIRYVGVEPDAQACAAARTRFPDLDLRCEPLETCTLAQTSLDWILLLGSLNHLADVRSCLAKLHGLLKPGGRMLVSDNTSFALMGNVRAKAEYSGTWYHHRNFDLPEARRVLQTCGFDVERERPIVPGGRNQWFLLARKPAS